MNVYILLPLYKFLTTQNARLFDFIGFQSFKGMYMKTVE